MAIKTTLLGHQRTGLELIHNKSYYAILYECGVGKTLTSLAIIDRRLERFPGYRTLVVAPNTIIENWAEEIEKHTDFSYMFLTGLKAKRLANLKTPANIYLINYEGVRTILDPLILKGFDLAIFDESQSLKDHTSLQSKSCFQVAMSCKHRMIMTGTPIHNTPLDAFGQFRVLSPDIFGTNYYRFRARYAIMGGYLDKMVLKYINMDDFKCRIKRVSDIKTKDEVLDLPPRVYEVIRVDLTKEQEAMYRSLRDNFIAEFKDSVVTAPVMLTRIMRFSQITAGFYKNVEGKEISYDKNPKQEWLLTWLKEHGHKTVVFVRFIHELHELEERLKAAKIRFVSVHGEIKDRLTLVREFNTEASCQVFIGQIDTAGAGINLQSSSYCVFLSNNYSYGDREQAESRIHRQGQRGSSCTFIDIVARNTIDERILSILKRKESLAQMLTKDIVKVV